MSSGWKPIAAWRDDFLSGGKEALKGRRGPLTEDDRQLREAERKIGELTMEVEVWRRAAEKRVLRCRGETAEIAVEASYPVATVCRILHAPHSTIYHRRATGGERCRPAPVPTSATSSCSQPSAWC